MSFLGEVVTSPYFYIPLFIKVLAGSFLASSYATGLFIPFIQEFTRVPLVNTYQTFFDSGRTDAFPYPFGMLLAMSSLYVLIHYVQDVITPLSLFLFRVPLIIADISILLVLLSWFKQHTKTVYLLYWMSPVLFYITYIHGQLDSIPIALLFIALFCISKKRDVLGLTVFGVACATKMSVVLIFPLIVVYLMKEREKKMITYLQMLMPGLVFFGINAPVIFSQGFYELVFKTKEQFKVLNLFFSFTEDIRVYVVPCMFLLLIFYFTRLKRYTRNIFMAFLAIAFSLLLLAIPPHQGWYFWVIPFVVYLYIQLPSSKHFSLYVLSFAYFIYFLVTKDSDFGSVSWMFFPPVDTVYSLFESHGVNPNVVVSLAFTFLQASLLYVVYTVYRYGLFEYTQQKLYYRPFILGIAGDSGSGKSTLASSLASVFSSIHTTVIKGDDMHKWERGHEKWNKYTHLDPLANDLHSEIETLRKIETDEVFFRKMYDHTQGTFTKPKKITPKRLVIFEGLHAFFLEKVRQSFDMRVYVSPEEQVRLHWKILRDASKRGYSKEKVLTILEQRKDDSVSFISVQEKHADVVFSLRNAVSLGDRLGDETVTLDLSLFVTCSNDVYLEPFLKAVSSYTHVDYAIFDTKQHVKIHGTITEQDATSIASLLFSQMDDITDEEVEWKGGYEGVVQLFTVYYLFEKVKLMRYGKQ